MLHIKRFRSGPLHDSETQQMVSEGFQILNGGLFSTLITKDNEMRFCGDK